MTSDLRGERGQGDISENDSITKNIYFLSEPCLRRYLCADVASVEFAMSLRRNNELLNTPIISYALYTWSIKYHLFALTYFFMIYQNKNWHDITLQETEALRLGGLKRKPVMNRILWWTSLSFPVQGNLREGSRSLRSYALRTLQYCRLSAG